MTDQRDVGQAVVDAIVGPGLVRVPGERGATVEVVEADKLAVRVRRVQVTSRGDVMERIARLPRALAGVEPVQVVEADARLGGIARSEAGEEYLEARVEGQSTEVVRVRAKDREVVPFTLTREALRRLVNGA